MKTIFIFVYTLVSISCEGWEHDNPINCYHISAFEITDIQPVKKATKSQPLPAILVISPGIYDFQGCIYNLEKAGVYRFYHVPHFNRQHIVFDGNIEKLIASLSWTMVQGNRDKDLSYPALKKKATQSVLSITCGQSAVLAVQILESIGIKARFATTLTLDSWTSYSNGHSFFEYYHPKQKKWILADPNKKITYWKGEEKLNLIETIDALKTDSLTIKAISAAPICDISGFSIGNKYNFNFANQHAHINTTSIQKRLKRILQIPIMTKKSHFVFTCHPSHVSRVHEYYPENRIKRTRLGVHSQAIQKQSISAH